MSSYSSSTKITLTVAISPLLKRSVALLSESGFISLSSTRRHYAPHLELSRIGDYTQTTLTSPAPTSPHTPSSLRSRVAALECRESRRGGIGDEIWLEHASRPRPNSSL